MVGAAVVVAGPLVAAPPPPPHAADSSPRADSVSMFLMKMAALSDTPATPVGVPVAGRVTAGLE